MIETLRTLVIDRIDLDEAVWLSLCAETLWIHYEAHELEPPDWLQDRIDDLKSEIKARRDDNLRKAIKDAEAELTKLASREEKRTDLVQKLAELKAKRGA